MSLTEMLRQERKLLKMATSNLSQEQLLAIPDGHKNNILWNYGHILVTQQLLHYKLSGQEMYVSNEHLAHFSRGTDPTSWQQSPDIQELDEMIFTHAEKLIEDYHAGRLANFQPYTTSTGIELKTIEDSIVFNHLHEGVHLGIILQLRKKV